MVIIIYELLIELKLLIHIITIIIIDDDEDPRVLGLAMVPGKHIMSICVDEIIPS